MPQRLFYQLSLMLPLLVPGALWVLPAPLLDRVDPHGNLVVLLWGSVLFAGWAYAPFAIAMAVWVQVTSPARLRMIAWMTPVFFVPVFLVGITTWAYLRNGSLDSQFAAVAGVLGGIALVLGYVYVVFVEVTRAIALRLGWLRPLDSAAVG